MHTLTRDAILSASDLPAEALDVPEWGGTVYVRVMSGAERERFEAEHTADPKTNVRARLAVYTLCDESGASLFTAADIPALNAKAGPALDRVFSRAIKLNKISNRDVEELEKNS